MSSRQTAIAGAVDVIVVGAGHCGLAMSHRLSERNIDHVVLERGEVANSWRTERWDSLRLLTPNWLTRLPGQPYTGDDPDGYMDMPGVVDFIRSYADRIDAPVVTGTTVERIWRAGGRYRIQTNHGMWHSQAVVLATGACNRPVVPRIAESLPGDLVQVTPHDYRNPDRLPEGGVLVVGASATGVQLADEIQRSGRPVTLAVGEHVRMPRAYRGRDVQWWMVASGLMDDCITHQDEPLRARRLPSPQLAGTPQRTTLDLNALAEAGVQLVGRLAGARDGTLQFSGALRNVCALADLKMNRLLDRFDDWATDRGLDAAVDPVQRFPATQVPQSPRLSLDLRRGEIRSIVWATGFQPDYGWLDLPVLDRRGALRHDQGVVDAPGLYVLGLPFLRKRKSSFIHGAGDDTRSLARHLAGFLDRRVRPAVTGIAV